MTHTVLLANGTSVVVGSGWAVTTLPCGSTVHAHPNADTPRMAQLLGYGEDVGALTEDHDLLHSLLAQWLGCSASCSLSVAAGVSSDHELAGLEEDAVLAIQRLTCALAQRRKSS